MHLKWEVTLLAALALALSFTHTDNAFGETLTPICQRSVGHFSVRD